MVLRERPCERTITLSTYTSEKYFTKLSRSGFVQRKRREYLISVLRNLGLEWQSLRVFSDQSRLLGVWRESARVVGLDTSSDFRTQTLRLSSVGSAFC